MTHPTARVATAGEKLKRHWPDPEPWMLTDPMFNAIWTVIKTWDINVPEAYGGYCGATGNHVRAIMDGLKGSPMTGVMQAYMEMARWAENEMRALEQLPGQRRREYGYDVLRRVYDWAMAQAKGAE